MTITEMGKNKIGQALPAGVMVDIINAKLHLMLAIEIACSREIRTDKDQRVINLLIETAKKLPIYIPELVKYC